MSSLGDAPIEVLLLVLNNVDQQSDLYECTLVNKSFYATANPLLWRAPRMAGGFNREDTILFRLKKSFRLRHKHCLRSTPLGHNVRKLDASEDDHLLDLRAVINNVPLVEELVIGIENLKDKDMERIALNCPQLKFLSLTTYFRGSDRFFDPLRHCTNLRELSILGMPRADVQLTPLQHCPLEKLGLGSYSFYSDFANDTFFGGIPTLTHLDMDYQTGAFFRYCQTLPSRTLFPVLTDLRIVMYQATNDNDLVLFFKSHPLICTLSLEKMPINQVVMTSLATDLVHLKYLTFIDNSRLSAITKAFHRVEKLTIFGFRTNAQHMAMYFPNLH
ncbi:hypothetical protein [Absidia glauca]|uniref:Uncharacterized protein n=1 Tax=Absidia glauca TaxID=4829 RepID=A0A168LXZ4_ABSGL|nr:hypothetical protein [Absidia glauca]